MATAEALLRQCIKKNDDAEAYLLLAQVKYIHTYNTIVFFGGGGGKLLWGELMATKIFNFFSL